MAKLVDSSGVTVFEGEIENGGSTPGTVRLVDLGIVESAVVAGEGMQTLYTPEAGEIAYGLMLLNWVASDQSEKTHIGAVADIEANDNNALGFFDNDVFAATYIPTVAVAAQVDKNLAQTAPVVAVWVSNDILVDGPVEPWQALHAYSVGDFISTSVGPFGAYVEKCTTAGTTGAAEPDWDLADPTESGDAEFTYVGTIPTAGSVHAYVHVALPAAP